ncbi:MAG: hypothetical protein C0601_07095 [Candidatus Muiribacterium halophilum]|uniref:ABC transporter domain-containing protein n=1 Tax=Muiribacterium halophilum TaxID=2053465 RepID=A0A2N5ZFV0_MUIH1|nr:MAG: hypothetical protein C0601_07095 [Candidatus Muirbacterium halophilum]
MKKYGDLQHELEENGLYEIDSKIKSILFGLGFDEEDLNKRCNEFSGGWVMRIHLAKLLLASPEILLLDEPTNHLDLEARNWLEDFIRSYMGAVILVSHDRFFLDATVNRVGELFASDFKVYKGNYSKFERLRQEYIDNIYKSAKEYDEKVEKHTKFIEKFRYKATKASQVQSRIKMLDKIEKPIIPPKKKRITFEFPNSKESGLKVIEVKDFAKQYDEKIVFMDVDFTIERGQRIAVCGKNGCGKTTLLKCLSDVVDHDMGEIEFGYNVKKNYYAQEPTELLSLENTLYDELYQNANFTQGENLRNLLGAFLFSNDDIYKKVKVLSGGERARLALAKMLLVPSNLLIMDEPTNHLDLESKDILLDALKKYRGTIIFVSHDRYFVENLANRVFNFHDGEMQVFNGSYKDFLKKVEY